MGDAVADRRIVSPSTVASGSVIVTARPSAPDPPSDCAWAKLSDWAVNEIVPFEESVCPPALVASTLASGVISALAPEPVIPAVRLRLTVTVSAVAWFRPFAATMIFPDPVTVPSSVARTGPPTTAFETMIEIDKANPKPKLSTFEVAVFVT